MEWGFAECEAGGLEGEMWLVVSCLYILEGAEGEGIATIVATSSKETLHCMFRARVSNRNWHLFE